MNYWLGKSLLLCEAAIPISAHCLKQLRTHTTQQRAQGGPWQWAKALGNYEWQGVVSSGKVTMDRKKKAQKQNIRVCCPPTKMGEKKSTSYIITLYLVKYKCAYMFVQESVHMWVSILQLVTRKEWKSLISQRWNRSQEKDVRIWGTMRYQHETKFKIQPVHFGNKNVILVYIPKRNLWGFLVFMQSSTGSFHNGVYYDF